MSEPDGSAAPLPVGETVAYPSRVPNPLSSIPRMFRPLPAGEELKLVRTASASDLRKYMLPLASLALERIGDRTRRLIIRRALLRDLRVARTRYVSAETWKDGVRFPAYFTWYIRERIDRTTPRK